MKGECKSQTYGSIFCNLILFSGFVINQLIVKYELPCFFRPVIAALKAREECFKISLKKDFLILHRHKTPCQHSADFLPLTHFHHFNLFSSNLLQQLFQRCNVFFFRHQTGKPTNLSVIKKKC